jgi:hypothetical protein
MPEGTFFCANHPDALGEPKLVHCRQCCCGRFEAKPKPVDRPEVTQPADGKTKLIPLTKGKVALVDAADFERLRRFKWHAIKVGPNYYACRKENGRSILMHREIMQPPEGMVVDHAKYNSLNNKRENLRVCTQAQNRYNTRHYGRKCPYKGVTPRGDQWEGQIKHKGVTHRLGLYDNPAEAARARDRKAIELFGEYAWLNFPDELRIVYLSGTIRLRACVRDCPLRMKRSKAKRTGPHAGPPNP